jgi:hypothetical protein
VTDPQSFNRYAYVQNDPVNFMDPLGLDPNGVLGGLLGVVAGMGPGTSTVTVSISSGPANVLGGDSHNQLLVVFLSVRGGGPQGTGAIGKVQDALLNPQCVDFYTRILNSPNINTKNNPVLEGGDLSKIFQHFLNQTQGGLT